MRKLLAAFLGVVIGAGATVAVQSPAAASYGTCPNGTSCFYTGTYGDGDQMVIPYSVYGGGGCFNLFNSFNSSISSVRNTWRNAHPIRVYSSYGCSGNYTTMTLELTHGLGSMDNRAQSFRVL